MTFSFKRSIAIFQKDYKDVLKNMYVSVSAFMPLALAAFYGRMGVETINVHYLIFNIIFCLVAAFVQCSLIAEEKEKNTLRGLMLSPASPLEVLTGKSLVSLIGTIIVIVVAALFQEYKPANLLVVSIAIILSALFYIGLGTVLGLMTKSVIEASVIILPFMGVFSVGSALTMFADKYPILKYAQYMPNAQLVDLANEVQLGAGLTDVWFNLMVILVWVIVTFSLAVVVFRKRMMD